MTRQPWTQERSDRGWRLVGWLLVLAVALQLFAVFAAVMALLTDR